MNGCTPTELLSFNLFVLAFFAWTGMMRGAGQYLKIEYPPSNATNELRLGVTYALEYRHCHLLLTLNSGDRSIFPIMADREFF
jgi:hypothetical protein